MGTDIVLQTEHLKKYFHNCKAVEDVTLQVRRGEILGFLGLNGAGKTTTLSMISGLTYPTAGEVTIFGQRISPNTNAVLQRVGTLVGSPALMLPFSARQNLQCMAYLQPSFPPTRIDEVLKQVGLYSVAHRAVRTFSTGMKQRLGLALALLRRPDLLILDEPINGMDSAGMHEIRELLRSLAAQEVTVFFSSHLLHEVELICDRVVVIHHGRIIAQKTIAELINPTTDTVLIRTADTAQTANVLSQLPGISKIKKNSSSVEVKGIDSETLIRHLTSHGITPQEVSLVRRDLESVFLELTQ